MIISDNLRGVAYMCLSMLAFTVNIGSKWVAARLGGGWAFARAVSPGLAMTVVGAALPVAWKFLSA